MAVRDMSIIHKNEETLSSGSFLKMPLALALMFGGAAYAVDTFTESPHTFTEESVEYTTDLRIGDSGKTMYVTNNTTAITVGNSKNFAVGAEANGNGSFVQNGGKLIVLTGHSHIDAEFIDPFVEVTHVCQKFEKADISTSAYQAITGMIDGIKNPDRSADDYTADAWSVCVFKTLSKELSLIRFGAGTDRYIHCESISPTTLTTKLSGAITWSSSDTSVATVSNGTVTGVSTGKCAIKSKDETGNIEVWIVDVA